MPSFVAYVVSLGCFAKSARRGRLSGPRLRPHSGRESEHILPLPLCSFHLELESFANLFFFNLIATCNECSAVTHAASPLLFVLVSIGGAASPPEYMTSASAVQFAAAPIRMGVYERPAPAPVMGMWSSDPFKVDSGQATSGSTVMEADKFDTGVKNDELINQLGSFMTSVIWAEYSC